MVKKDAYLKDLKSIQEMAGQIRTLNEAIRFNEGDFEDYDEFGAEPVPEELGDDEVVAGESNLEKANPEEEGLKELEKGGELDKIREITLHGMIALNKTPEDPKFQALLKIFNICNKAVNENGEQETQKQV